MKFIFLDIDGVLVTQRSVYSGLSLDPATVRLLRRIVQAGDFRVVISSSRRQQGLFLFSEWLCARHQDADKIVKAFAPEWCTPDLSAQGACQPELCRAQEILEYCRAHNVAHCDCLVLDDLDLRPCLPNTMHFVRSDENNGLSYWQLHQVEGWVLANA
jgi:hypothetical protein